MFSVGKYESMILGCQQGQSPAITRWIKTFEFSESRDGEGGEVGGDWGCSGAFEIKMGKGKQKGMGEKGGGGLNKGKKRGGRI